MPVGIHSTTPPTAMELAVALCNRHGIPVIHRDMGEVERRRFEETLDRATRLRSICFDDICRHALRLANKPEAACKLDTIREASSTGELQYIFSSAANLALQSSYAEAPDSTAGWVLERDVEDFKTIERPRMMKGGGLRLLPRGAEAAHASPSDTRETYKVHRFAQQFVVDEQDVVDDRTNALLDFPVEMGYAAKRLKCDLAYYSLLANANLSDGVPLFDASHGNLTTAALDATSVQAAVTAMSSQRENDIPLNIRSAWLIVPSDLKFAASILLRSAERIVAVSSGGTYNPLAMDENIGLRSDSRLSTAGCTDPVTQQTAAGSTTNWYLAADPRVAPTIEIGYIRDTGRTPQLRSFTLERGRYGFSFDVKHDIGVAVLDYRGLHKSTGVA